MITTSSLPSGARIEFDGAWWWLTAERRDGTHRVGINRDDVPQLVYVLLRDEPALSSAVGAVLAEMNRPRPGGAGPATLPIPLDHP